MTKKRLFAVILALAGAFPSSAACLFTSFRGNGDSGVFAAISDEGRVWIPLNHNQPWVKPEYPGMLMRDPWLGRGPDGVWHMLWTWGWTAGRGGPPRMGHTSSPDLIHWEPQQEIRVMEDDPQTRNVWAPEAVWDDKAAEWVIFWASTVPGRFAATDKDGDNGYNHRIFSTRTKDWKTFAKTTLYFDPGFSTIDSTIVPDGERWIMVFKDERKTPLQKRLRLAFATSPQGPWTGVTKPFTRDWVEGPTVAKIGDTSWIYYDHYTPPQHVGALTTRDWKKFKEVTGELHFPDDHRHGTVVWVPHELVGNLPR
jgi:hypothetical protein